MKHTLLFAAILWAVMSSAAIADVPQPVLDAETQRVEAIQRASKSFVAVFANGGKGGGSGVVISPDGYALSNFHVTSEPGDWMKCGMSDGKLYDAVIVGIDPVGDVALIKLLGREDFPAAEIADSDDVRAGDWCFAAGNPFLLATNFHPTISYGIISGIHRYQYPAGTLLEYADCIQVDAAINPGNSGGPLFNAEGQLIGINGRGSFEKRGRVNVGVGYAISINQIQNFLGCLKSGRILDHATLGAVVGADENGRVVVTDILESSDAYRRGLRYDDEIVMFAGRPINTVNALKNALGIFPKDWRVPLTYRRDGIRKDILVRLQGVHSPAELLKKIGGIVPPDEKKTPEEKPNDKPTPLGAAEKPPMPEVVKQHFQKRAGYANYYFNRLHRDQVWATARKLGDFSMFSGSWRLTGSLELGEPIQAVISDDSSTIELPIGDYSLETTAELGVVPNPPGSGGLLAAMYLWRKLLSVGPEKLGETSYLGQFPHPAAQDLVEVLRVVDAGVEARFMFLPDNGQLIAMELFADDEVDPCEIIFQDYRAIDGRQLPHLLEVRYGDGVFGRLQLTRIELAAGAPTTEAN